MASVNVLDRASVSLGRLSGRMSSAGSAAWDGGGGTGGGTGAGVGDGDRERSTKSIIEAMRKVKEETAVVNQDDAAALGDLVAAIASAVDVGSDPASSQTHEAPEELVYSIVPDQPISGRQELVGVNLATCRMLGASKQTSRQVSRASSPPFAFED